jgi:TonB family protein
MKPIFRTLRPSKSAATEIEWTLQPGRFRGALLLVSDGPYSRRGLLYSLLIHAAAAFVILSVPIPVQHAADLFEAEPVAFDPLPASDSGLSISRTAIEQQTGAATRVDARQTVSAAPERAAVTRCCSRQTIVSNPPEATNRVQTILQPDFADRPPLNEFVPLPDMLKLAPISSASTNRTRPSDASPPRSLESDLRAIETAPVLAAAIAPALPAPTSQSPAPSGTKDSQLAPETIRQDRGGDDPRDVLALSVVAAPPSDVVPIPMGESRGEFVILAAPNPTAADRESGEATSHKAGVANKTSAAPRPENDASRAEPTFSSQPKGAAPGANSPRAANPFAGITIQGGEWNHDLRAVDSAARDTRADESEITSYPLSIASTGNSGGGLKDFGVFYNQMVYTNYFTIERTKAPFAPPFVLQFALVEASSGSSGSITPPRPAIEVLPHWPEEIVTPYTGEMVVVYAEITLEGKLRDARVLESPSVSLNRALLDALVQWTFHPAAVNGQPAAVKALLGVPLVPDE